MTNRIRKTIACRIAVCVALLCFAAAAGAQTSDWKSYSYATDGFAASFPTSPSVQTKDVPTDAGSFELHSYVAQDADVALFVGVCDYGAATKDKDPQALLQGAKNAAMISSSSHVLSEKKITLGVNPGLAFEAENDATHLSLRVYMVGSTLYQTLVVMPKDKPYAHTAQFLDSFQLVAKKAN